MKRFEAILLVLLIVALPVGGYGFMHGLVYVLPLSTNGTGVQVVFTLLIIVFGLLIPYWMLKAGIHVVCLSDPLEEEVKLKDIPKEMDELAESRK
ncbi:MAG: hypothetical protein HY221_00160 [Candidatus Sungbacteria bacterium]|uniref:Uncharacterized protein n=1 Tax=Candidatus Sungiibacteriota bacterium TaxID=2750080 RepID=A0A932QYB8_9BACT|nr:hypothetical protein [Candidatus Sungbacteria bacterium]